MMSKPLGKTRVGSIVHKLNVLLRERNAIFVTKPIDLTDQVKTECHRLGLGYGNTTQLAEWIVDGGDPNGAEPEDEDHWQNMRPY